MELSISAVPQGTSAPSAKQLALTPLAIAALVVVVSALTTASATAMTTASSYVSLLAAISALMVARAVSLTGAKVRAALFLSLAMGLQALGSAAHFSLPMLSGFASYASTLLLLFALWNITKVHFAAAQWISGVDVAALVLGAGALFFGAVAVVAGGPIGMPAMIDLLAESRPSTAVALAAVGAAAVVGSWGRTPRSVLWIALGFGISGLASLVAVFSSLWSVKFAGELANEVVTAAATLTPWLSMLATLALAMSAVALSEEVAVSEDDWVARKTALPIISASFGLTVMVLPAFVRTMSPLLVVLLVLGLLLVVFGLVRLSAAVRHQGEVESLRGYLATDELTGLPSRHGLRELVGAREPQTPYALLYLEVDGYRAVASSCGYEAADGLLRSHAERLSVLIPEGGIVARVGGGEQFVLFVPDVSAAQAKAVAASIREGLDDHLVTDDLFFAIDNFVGIAAYPGDGDDFAAVMRAADIARERAKESRVDRVRAFRPEDDFSADRLRLVTALRASMSTADDGGLVLYYQPQIDLATNEISGVEALIRWNHEGSIVAPADFLPMAAQSGLMGDLTRLVLRQACHQAAQWYRDGNPVSVAVNVSADGVDASLVFDVEEALRASGLPARYLHIEITEDVFLADPEEAGHVLAALRSRGVTVAIDDFGTGYAGLSYLRDLAVDVVKIDQSFVKALTTDPTARAIVRTVVALASELGLSTVAEGVEDTASYALLAEYETSTVQGYLLSRPLPAREFEDWLKNRSALEAELSGS